MTTAETALGIVWLGFGAYAGGAGVRIGAGPLSFHALAAVVCFVAGTVLLALSEDSEVRVPDAGVVSRD